jgi:hypothetical protein
MSTLNTVHDDDFSDFLKSVGLLKNVEDGKVRCKFCGDTVTVESIFTVFPDSGTIHVTCSKPSCAEALQDYLEEKEMA